MPKVYKDRREDSTTRFLKLFVPEKGVTLSLNERAVWSYLAYAAQIDRKPTQAEIADDLGLTDRTVRNLIPKAVKIIPDSFQARKGETSKLFDCFRYYKVYLPKPDSGLSLAHATIYAMILSQQDRHWSSRYFEKAVGKGRRQVKGILADLQRLKLITLAHDEGGFYAAASPVEQNAALFRPAKKDEVRARANRLTGNGPYYFDYAKKIGISHRDACKVAEAAEGMDLHLFHSLADKAKAGYDSATHRHCGYLLLAKIREARQPFEMPNAEPLSQDEFYALRDKLVAKFGQPPAEVTRLIMHVQRLAPEAQRKVFRKLVTTSGTWGECLTMLRANNVTGEKVGVSARPMAA